jgi:hypothetical protein
MVQLDTTGVRVNNNNNNNNNNSNTDDNNDVAVSPNNKSPRTSASGAGKSPRRATTPRETVAVVAAVAAVQAADATDESSDAVLVDDVAVQADVVKPALSPRANSPRSIDATAVPAAAAVAGAASDVDTTDTSAGAPPPVERTRSQMRAVFQRVAGGDAVDDGNLIVKVVFKNATKSVSMPRTAVVGDLLLSAFQLFVRMFPDEITLGRIDLWAPIGPVWLERDAVLNDTVVPRCVREDLPLALGSMFEKPDGPEWGHEVLQQRATTLVQSPRDRAKKLIESMSRRTLNTSAGASPSLPRSSSSSLSKSGARVELNRSDSQVRSIEGDPSGDANPVDAAVSPAEDGSPGALRRRLTRSDRKGSFGGKTPERVVSRPIEVKRTPSSTSNLELERGSGASMGMSEIRGHVFINVNAIDDSTRWRKCWLVGNESTLEYHYVEDNFTRVKNDNDVAGARDLLNKARVVGSEDAVLKQRLDELASVLDDTAAKLAATPENNYADRKRLLALQRNVSLEIKTVCRDAIKRLEVTSTPSDLADSSHYRRDLDSSTRQFKVIPVSAVRRVEFKPSPTAEFDFCLHVAHSRRTGNVVMTQRNSVLLTDASKAELSSALAAGTTPTSASKLRNTELPGDDNETDESSDEGAGNAASAKSKEPRETATAVASADEYTVPFFVRADNRQNRIMWIWGLDIMFSRRDLGTLPRASLPRVAIVYEIYLTEKQYVMRLDELIVQWMLPLVNSKTLTESESAHIFGNLERLLEANQRVLSAMTTRFEQEMWDADRSVLGDVWLAAMSSLSVYKAYSVTFVSANAAIKRLLRENKTFREFHDARPGVLSSALIAPVQRVPRYMLLFRDLLEKTPPQHPDHALVTQCVERVTALADDVNRSVRDHESRSAIAEISQQLVDLPPDLLNRGGVVFVRQGILRRVTTRRTVTTLLLLFNEFLVYAQHDLVGVGNMWRFKGVIQLPYTWLRNLNDTDNVKNGFHLVTPRKTYLMLSKTDSDKALWMRDLSGVIDDYLDRNPQFNEFRHVAKLQMRKKTGLWRLLTKDLAAEIEVAEKSREAETASSRDLQPLQITSEPLVAPPASGAPDSPAMAARAAALATPSSTTSSSSGSPAVSRASMAELGPAVGGTATAAAAHTSVHTTSDRHRSVLVAGELDLSQLGRGRSWRPRAGPGPRGAAASGETSNDGSSIETEDDEERLYLIKYLAPLDRYLVRRVTPALSSLARNVSFVLVLDRICVWHGDEASDDDRRRATQLARAIASAAPPTSAASKARDGHDDEDGVGSIGASLRHSPSMRRKRIADVHTFLPALTALDPEAPMGDANSVKVTRRIDELRLLDFAQNVKLFKIRDADDGGGDTHRYNAERRQRRRRPAVEPDRGDAGGHGRDLATAPGLASHVCARRRLDDVCVGGQQGERHGAHLGDDEGGAVAAEPRQAGRDRVGGRWRRDAAVCGAVCELAAVRRRRRGHGGAHLGSRHARRQYG